MESALHWPADLTERLTKIINRIGFFEFDDLDPYLLAKFSANDLTEVEKKGLISLMSRIYGMEGVFSPEVQSSLASAKIEDSEIFSALGWDEQFHELEAALASPSVIAAARSEVLQKCHESVVKAFAAAPSELRQRKANELLQEVKRAAKVAAQSYLSGDALLLASDSIDLAGFTSPMGSNAIQSYINQKLSSSAQRMTSMQMGVKDAAQGGTGWQALLVQTVGRVMKKPSEVITRSVVAVCDSLKPASFEDKALLSIGMIQMGWQTASFPEIGAGIMAHEIGHIVSRGLQGQSQGVHAYEVVRSCSAEQHAGLIRDADFLGSFRQFQEEDWADAFAVTTLKELKKTWPYAKNFACALVKQDEKDREEKWDLSDLRGIDSHSTGFYRALQVHVGFGNELPASCKSALPADDLKVMSRSCAK